METFLSTLTIEQLKALKNTIKGEIFSRKQKVAPPVPPKKKVHPIENRIRISNIQNMTDEYEDTREDIMDAMGDIRSTRIYVDQEKREAIVTFENAELASKAVHLLRQKYHEVKIF